MEERRRRNWAIGTGLLLTLAGALSYFTVFSRFPALRDVPWVNVPAVLAGLALSMVGAWRAWSRPAVWRGRVLGTAALLLSALLAAGFLAYVFILSSMLPAPSQATLAMESAPDFELARLGGGTVRLSGLRGTKVVLVFYRGFW